jgi:hypothetical protein
LPDGNWILSLVAEVRLLFVISLSHRILHHSEVVLSDKILSLDLVQLIVLWKESFLVEACNVCKMKHKISQVHID